MSRITTLLFLNTILLLSNGFVLRRFSSCIRNSLLVLSMGIGEDDDLKQWAQKSEMIFLFPLKAASMDDLTLLRKGMPHSIMATGVSTKKFIEAVDGTAYCQLMTPLSAFDYTAFAVFVDSPHDIDFYDYFTKWIKQIRKESDAASNSNFILARKGCLIEISPSTSDIL